MKTSSKFWDRIAESYAARPVPDKTVYEAKLKRTRDLFTSDMQVLEIGCGTGTTALEHAPFVKRILATDFSKEMIKIASSRAAEQGIENVEFRCAAIEDLSDESGTFDVVMGHSVLHLVDDRATAIARAHRLLKPGGYFVTSTACITGWFLLLKPLWPIVSMTGLLPRVAFFSSDTLVAEHEQAGFAIEQRWQSAKQSLFMISRKH